MATLNQLKKNLNNPNNPRKLRYDELPHDCYFVSEADLFIDGWRTEKIFDHEGAAYARKIIYDPGGGMIEVKSYLFPPGSYYVDIYADRHYALYLWNKLDAFMQFVNRKGLLDED